MSRKPTEGPPRLRIVRGDDAHPSGPAQPTVLPGGRASTPTDGGEAGPRDLLTPMQRRLLVQLEAAADDDGLVVVKNIQLAQRLGYRSTGTVSRLIQALRLAGVLVDAKEEIDGHKIRRFRVFPGSGNFGAPGWRASLARQAGAPDETLARQAGAPSWRAKPPVGLGIEEAPAQGCAGITTTTTTVVVKTREGDGDGNLTTPEPPAAPPPHPPGGPEELAEARRLLHEMAVKWRGVERGPDGRARIKVTSSAPPLGGPEELARSLLKWGAEVDRLGESMLWCLDHDRDESATPPPKRQAGLPLAPAFDEAEYLRLGRLLAATEPREPERDRLRARLTEMTVAFLGEPKPNQLTRDFAERLWDYVARGHLDASEVVNHHAEVAGLAVGNRAKRFSEEGTVLGEKAKAAREAAKEAARALGSNRRQRRGRGA